MSKIEVFSCFWFLNNIPIKQNPTPFLPPPFSSMKYSRYYEKHQTKHNFSSDDACTKITGNNHYSDEIFPDIANLMSA